MSSARLSIIGRRAHLCPPDVLVLSQTSDARRCLIGCATSKMTTIVSFFSAGASQAPEDCSRLGIVSRKPSIQLARHAHPGLSSAARAIRQPLGINLLAVEVDRKRFELFRPLRKMLDRPLSTIERIACRTLFLRFGHRTSEGIELTRHRRTVLREEVRQRPHRRMIRIAPHRFSPVAPRSAIFPAADELFATAGLLAAGFGCST